MWIWIGGIVYALIGLVLTFLHVCKAREEGGYIDVFSVTLLTFMVLLTAYVWYVVLLLAAFMGFAYGIARGILYLSRRFSRVDKSE